MSTPRPALAAACAALALAAACSAKAPVADVRPLPMPVPAPAVVQDRPNPRPAAPTDAIAELIALSEQHFEAGRSELQDGHLETARVEFDRALEVLLEAPDGGRGNARIREHFDRLVDRISAAELAALAQGDGFAERAHEPASIDELLAITTFTPPEPTAETTEAVAEDLELTRHDIDIPLNARVLSYVELFSGKLKGYLEDGLNRGAPYLPMIQEVFRAEGLPLDLIYVPLIESAFKPNAVSRAKAKGMWQFMRGTALENGLKHDWYIDERADPEKATRAAAKYLKTLYGMFGDWHLALASYNGGPGRVQRAMRQSGKKDFWALSANRRYLPRETRDYVPLILAAIVVARNPAQYGLVVQPPAQDASFERVTVHTAVDLRKVAEWTGVPVKTIQELNPELRRWTTPVREGEYELKVPAGSGDLVRERLAEADPAELAPLNRHTVKKGETLLSIARKLKVSRADLAEANYLPTNAKLQVGQQLIVPREPTLLLATRTDAPAESAPVVGEKNVAAGTGQGAGKAAATAPATTASRSAPAAPLVHRVKSGDTLFSIAKRYDTTVDDLKRWNRLSSNRILVGQRLTVQEPRTVATN